jgi:hypothetical protein
MRFECADRNPMLEVAGGVLMEGGVFVEGEYGWWTP